MQQEECDAEKRQVLSKETTVQQPAGSKSAESQISTLKYRCKMYYVGVRCSADTRYLGT